MRHTPVTQPTASLTEAGSAISCYLHRESPGFSPGCRRFAATFLLAMFALNFLVHGQDPVLDSIEARKTLERLESDADYRREMSRWDVFLYDVEMGTERRLTNSGTEEQSPDLSEDGRFLAYSVFGRLYVEDLFTGGKVHIFEGMNCYYPQWVPGTGKLSVYRNGKLTTTIGDSDFKQRRSELVLINPDGTGEELLLDPNHYSVHAFKWHPSEKHIAIICERIIDGVWELCLLVYGEEVEPRVLQTFEKGHYPDSVHWMPGGERLLVLNQGEKLYPTMFGLNIATGVFEELYRAGMSRGNFDLSCVSGRLALSERALHFDENYKADPRMPEVVKVSGDDVKWYQADKFILYRDYRLPEGLIERLKKGIPLPDDRMFLLMEGGGVGHLTDPDNEHSLYVKEEKVEQNGSTTTAWVDLTLEEAQAYVDLYDPGVVLGPNGPDLEKGKRPKIEMAPGRPVYD